MAKRFKGDIQVENDLQVDNNLSLPSQTASRALEIDGSGNAVSSSVTSTELGRLSGVTGDIQTQLDAKQATSEKGAANGYASLDSGGKVPAAQLPSSLMDYQGAWNASTNTPSLADGVGDNGDVYRVSVAGTQDLGSGDITVAVGDFIIYNGSIWERSPAVDAVTSVFSRQGDVVAAASDYDADQIDYDNSTSGLTATEVQSAIDEVEGRVDGLEVVTTQGDLVVGDVSGDPSRLGIGTNGQLLTSNGTTASWQDAPAGSDENVKISANDTTAGYLEDKVVVSSGTNSTNPLEVSTLNDAGDEDLQIQFDESKVVHDNLSGFVANEHVDHSSVNINTNVDSGLTGGGDLTSSRTLSVDINGTTSESSAADADEVLVYDVSAGALRKMTRSDFVGSPNASAGDISETSFSGANNQAAAANVTGLAFANGTVRSFRAQVFILVDADTDLYEVYNLEGIQRGADWVMDQSSTGDDTNVNFTITTAGQIQYTSDNYTGFVSLTIKFRAETLSV